ncbi:MAG: hypothetical protein JJ900_09125 [Rhodospirillales bacterium]|nr:hypothetical protein [Rhodospirillales bacterium]MBO6786999.1 hypothetical protein [Rhodospirillales bacterium]
MIGIVFFCATTADAATCAFPDSQSVHVTIQRNDGRVTVNNAHSRESLRRMQRQSGRASAFGSAWTPVGLTLTELKYSMRLKVEAQPVSDGGYCARVTAVEADLGYDNLRIFIARKFRPGSCAYRSINAHEMTHVAVFKQALDRFYPRLQHRLQRAAETLDPVRTSNPDRAAAYLRKRLSASVEPLFLEMNRELDRNNARLDTPERYRREQALCTDW